MFDLHESDQSVYTEQGLGACRAHQREREDIPLDPGTPFPLVRGILAINERAGEQLTEVVILSRNEGDSGLPITNSINDDRYAFTRSPDAADLSMAAMTSWRRTASAKSGTVWVSLSMSTENAA